MKLKLVKFYQLLLLVNFKYTLFIIQCVVFYWKIILLNNQKKNSHIVIFITK